MLRQVNIYVNLSAVREVIFYKSEKGDCPVERFLDSLSAKHARKVTWVLQLIETLPMVPSQYFKKLDGTDGIWEVRVQSGTDTLRLLGFMAANNFVVLTNGFAKKTQKIPGSEITLAERRKRSFDKRF